MQTALLIIDIQNDYFDGGKWTLHKQAEAAQNAAKLLATFRQQNLPVIHVQHINPTEDAAFFAKNSIGAEIHDSVTPRENEILIVKQQINSFLDTELNAVLKELDVETLVICGSMSHMCIDAGVRAAADLGYACQLAHDACATLSMSFNGVEVPAEHVHAAFMAALSFAYAEVTTTEALITAQG